MCACAMQSHVIPRCSVMTHRITIKLQLPGKFRLIFNNELILTVPTHSLPCYNEYFVLSLTVSKNDMMIQMVDKANTSLIGQDGETLTFKALLYLNSAVHVQVCRLFCVVYILLLSLVQLGYPAITIFFAVNQIIRYNGVFAITKTPLQRTFFSVPCMTLRYSGVPL